MDVIELEAQTGLRFSWNVFPPTRAEATKIELPLGGLYTPLKASQHFNYLITVFVRIVITPQLEYEPLRCRQSGCVLNPYCQIDKRNKTWICPFSGIRNPFPPKYAEHIADERLPPELVFPTVDYILPAHSGGIVPAPSFLFVVDTCLFEEELDTLKDSLQQVLNFVPQDSNIGLITYGAMCHVHELGKITQSIAILSEFQDSWIVPKSYVFRGSKPAGHQEVQQQLGLISRDPRGGAGGAAARRFLLPISECEFAFNAILDDLQKDQWPVPTDHRAERCTGVALSVALALLESCATQQSGRVLLFTGGVCTSGPGQIVGTSLNEVIRHHLDLQKETENAKYVKKALRYYTELADRAVAAGHAVDIFACSLDQVGLYEMRVCSDKTGGFVVMSDSFSMNVFKDSFRKIFEADSTGYLQHAYNAKLEVLCSRELKVCGAIGSCTSTGKKGLQVGETCVGEGGTCEWVIPALDKRTTLAFYFEVVTQNQSQVPPSRQAFLQFQTLYHHPSGRRRLRVSTVSHRFGEPGSHDLVSGFDQEAAAVLMARLAVFKTEQEDCLDVLRWLDRKLIRLVSRFADYQKDDPATFHLGQEFSIYPQFMYHLRRSHFLQTFNASPDETAYYRTVLLRENVLNSLVMIQPALFQYTFDGPPKAVMLDVQSLRPEVILLLDSFFHVVVWHGDTIHSWKEQGYDQSPEFQNFKELLEAPQKDAKALLEDRFPAPKFVVCNAGGSQARFLLAKVNPSATHNTMAEMNDGGYGGQPVDASNYVITDDVSLKVFMEHLIKLAVQS
ncbi:LOW QUALITY PROTEIN: uncharacterized protein LOC129618233 [Condylostylus longicornis]|uniref:LOW QUALITY PROTEIN: uncharacterized protein LOC129618233 n=1 Tax=Condylostylus longicornis TaxID=2530218 RepID=UPI00244DEEF9|nr:LOW QUALITY PROTEIN: uncharacterized protein LOC129618233 [Condylostylus longicornis]